MDVDHVWLFPASIEMMPSHGHLDLEPLHNLHFSYLASNSSSVVVEAVTMTGKIMSTSTVHPLEQRPVVFLFLVVYPYVEFHFYYYFSFFFYNIAIGQSLIHHVYVWQPCYVTTLIYKIENKLNRKTSPNHS